MNFSVTILNFQCEFIISSLLHFPFLHICLAYSKGWQTPVGIRIQGRTSCRGFFDVVQK
uniref:Uncharacterized protein n=1 Tax=Anguilla anguilla TaxID=7936 RepID=A0A0E9WMB3_ANGAN